MPTTHFPNGITLGNSSTNGDLIVTGASTITGAVGVTGNTTLTGDLTVTGTTNLALPVYADNAAAVAGGLAVGALYQVTTTAVVQVVTA